MNKKLINTILILFFAFLSHVSTAQTLKINEVADCYYYKGHTYVYIKKQVIWHTARDLCTRVGGYLVIINNSTENRSIKKILSDDTWMGLTDEKSEGRYKWINGKSAKYLD